MAEENKIQDAEIISTTPAPAVPEVEVINASGEEPKKEEKSSTPQPEIKKESPQTKKSRQKKRSRKSSSKKTAAFHSSWALFCSPFFRLFSFSFRELPSSIW